MRGAQAGLRVDPRPRKPSPFTGEGWVGVFGDLPLEPGPGSRTTPHPTLPRKGGGLSAPP